MKIRIAIICFILLLTGHLFAEEKKTIQVRFSITEPQYKDYYHSETKLIENKCAALMVDYLNKTFGFFHFTIGTNQPALHIELTDNERNIETNSTLKEVGFKVFIKHQENLGNEKPVYWVFRPVERYIESLPDVKEEFIDEIVQTFKIGVSKNKEELVKNILSKVEVADDFYFIQDKKLFILPLAEKENNIAKFSLFLIITSIPDDILGSVESYDTTQVTASIKNREEAILKYKLPNSYPEGSLAVKKLAVGSDEIPIDSANMNAIIKKIFILKHLPLVNTDIEIISPESFFRTSNPQ